MNCDIIALKYTSVWISLHAAFASTHFLKVIFLVFQADYICTENVRCEWGIQRIERTTHGV